MRPASAWVESTSSLRTTADYQQVQIAVGGKIAARVRTENDYISYFQRFKICNFNDTKYNSGKSLKSLIGMLQLWQKLIAIDPFGATIFYE